MLEVYSKNVTVVANTAIPLENVSVKKGCTAEKNGSTITLNKCGVYCVSCDASSENGISIQLQKNGVLQPQAITLVGASTDTTAETPDYNHGSFTTLVQVPTNNSNCPCASGVELEFINGNADTTYTQFNVVITKLV